VARAATYTVSFNAQGGSPVPAPTAVADGSLVPKPADPTSPSRFLGWSETSVGELWDFNTNTVRKNLVLYAQWQVQYFVVFDAQGGVPASSVQVRASGTQAQRPPDPAKAGFAFTGWVDADSGAAYTFATPVTRKTTLRAQYRTIAPPKAPATPGKIIVKIAKKTQVKLSWGPRARANIYRVQYKAPGAKTWRGIDTSEPAINLGKIAKKSGKYTFRVRAGIKAATHQTVWSEWRTRTVKMKIVWR